MTVTTSSVGTIPITVDRGGTGKDAWTNTYRLLATGTSATGPPQEVTEGTSGHVLTSNGSGVLPTFQATAATEGTFETDSGTATSSSNTITIAGGSNISTSGATSTVTCALNSDVLGLTNLTVDNVGINGNTIASTDTDGNLTITANGAGSVVLPTVTAAAPLFVNIDSHLRSLPLTNGQLLVGSSGLSPVAAGITAGAGISVTNGAGTITIANSSTQIAWEVITAATAMVANVGYFVNGTAKLVLTLPATAAVGDFFAVYGVSVNGWTIAQNAGQSIRVITSVTTAGTTGGLTSFVGYDGLVFICTVADTEFTAIQSMGTVTIDPTTLMRRTSDAVLRKKIEEDFLPKKRRSS